jgi:hypothetical protein
VDNRKPPPNAKSDSDYEDSKKREASTEEQTCCICMCEPEQSEESTISGCQHIFCWGCISKWSDRENTCPLCKCRFTKITRVHQQRRKKGSSTPVQNSKKVKQRDQLADFAVPGAALESLLQSIAAASAASGGTTRLSRFVRAARISSQPHRRTVLDFPGALFPDSDEDDDDDDNDDFLPGFMSVLLRSSSARHVPVSVHVHDHRHPPFMSRTYATNASDQTAGRAASNPLTIDDTDDDDDEVEVITVTRRTSSATRNL